MNDHSARLPARADFPWYLASSGAWLAGASLQMFLLQWLLVFHLQVDGGTLGVSRALMEIPPLAMLVIGGIYADLTDARRLLVLLAVAACVPPLIVALALGHLSYWPIIGFGIAMALLQSASDPARAAMLNRVTRIDIQRTVTVTTVATTLLSLAAYAVAGRLDALGLGTVLVLQAALFLASAATAAKLPPMPPQKTAPGLGILDALPALWRTPVLRDSIVINFVSSLFNAGAYVVVMPLVVRDVYAGDAAFLANMLIAFTIASTGANFALLLFMPLRRPGRVFLIMQLTRLAILAGLWMQPPTWLFFALIAAWGVNMGVTSTLVRTTVQELAPAEHRAKILAILLGSFMVASPISALILGFLATLRDAIDALLPGVAVSLGIFAVGYLGSRLWQFESPSRAGAAPAGP